MKILVLGGTRYFGKRLVQRLIEAGHDLTCATRGQATLPPSSVRHLRFDRTDPLAVARVAAAGKWDAVIDQICYSPDEAFASCRAFDGRAARYVHVSTQSVYLNDGLQKESDFDPREHRIQRGPREDFDYGEGKRQAEAVYFQTARFPIAAVRLPFVLGPDDYTKRLEFHLDRVAGGLPIVVPNLAAETSFISSAESARFIHWFVESAHTGPLNACSTGALSIGAILALIEAKTGRKANVLSNGEDEDATPFTGRRSRVLDNSAAQGAGFSFEALGDWLPALIAR